MNDTLQWSIRGEKFENGSRLKDWVKIEESGVWHWQYDAHELTFHIYEHDGQYWKLYLARWVTDNEYKYDFGGQACRMTLIEYKTCARSPHSKKLMQVSDLEWVRTYEVDEKIHRIVKAGAEDSNYDSANYSKKSAA